MELMTTDDVAEMIGSKPEWLRRLRQKKEGPKYSKLGALVRYKREDVVAWIDSRAVQTADA